MHFVLHCRTAMNLPATNETLLEGNFTSGVAMAMEIDGDLGFEDEESDDEKKSKSKDDE